MIDEKKLIEEFEKLKQEVNMPVDIVWNNLLKVCIDTVNEQPKVGEWIPVTELDLDHDQEALIKLDDGFICSAKFLISDSGNNCGVLS